MTSSISEKSWSDLLRAAPSLRCRPSLVRRRAMTDVNDDEFEELPEREPAWLRLDRATAYRKRLLAAGYLPLPVNGKVPPIKGWPDIEATDVLIDRWANEYADATNTGTITHRTPAVDIDVLDPVVADELQELAERMIGKSAVRTGRAPKRAMLFRADKPLSKISTPVFVSPDGRTHKVEILGWGQQIVVHGTHPDTQAPYTWEHTEPGSDLKANELPLLTAEKANEFVTAAAQCMIAHGWTPKKRTNGAAGPVGFLDGQKAASERVSGFMQMLRLTAVRANSARHRKVNATILCTKRRSGSEQCPRAAGSRLWRCSTRCSLLPLRAASTPTTVRKRPARR